MGVKWLTSFVRDVERIVSSQVNFPVSDVETSKPEIRPTFVVDAWALIYHAWLSYHGDMMRDLDYHLYQGTLQKIIGAWHSAGISVVLVFDGPQLPAKMPKIIERRGGIAASNSAYMKSSPSSRTSVRFQTQCGFVPPLLLCATIEACEKIQSGQVEMIFATTEADSLVAEIATEKEQAYAVSLDSDYFILCARGRSCPYVPLDSIEYVVKVPVAEEPVQNISTQQEFPDDMDGFVQVKGGKRGAKKAKMTASIIQSSTSIASRQLRLLPPDSEDEEKLSSVSIRAYRPQDLASHLNISPILLPLLAALVGNDYTTTLQSNILFRQYQGPQRVSEAASLVRSEWLRIANENKTGQRDSKKVTTAGSRLGHTRATMSNTSREDSSDDGKSEIFGSAVSSAMATPTRNTPGPPQSSTLFSVQDPVRAMIAAIVEKAIKLSDAGHVNPRYTSTGEKELIVESIIDSVATYSLLTNIDAPHLASPSAIFFGVSPSLTTTDTSETIASPAAIERYRQAYDKGHLDASLIEGLTLRIYIATVGAEDADVKSVQVTAARELRFWLWGILFDAWGMTWAREEWEEPVAPQEESVEEVEKMSAKLSMLDKGYKEGERPDDVISVDTESSHSVTLDSEEDDDEDEVFDDLLSFPGSVADLRKSAVAKPAPGVVEYIRKGHQYTGELIQILSLQSLLDGILTEDVQLELPPSLVEVRDQYRHAQEQATKSIKSDTSTLLSPALMPLNVRLDLYLHAHQSCTSKIQSLPKSWWPIAATLRLSIRHEAERLGPGKKKANWSRDEIMAALQSASTALRRSTNQTMQQQSVDIAIQEVLPSTRAIHLASTVQLLLKTSHLVAQSLLLPVDVTNWPGPHTLYHGPTFHRQLHDTNDENHAAPPSTQYDSILKTVLEAITIDLEDDLGIDMSELKRERKARKKEAKIKSVTEAKTSNGDKSTNNSKKSSRQAVRNAFALLDEGVD